jgi:hypothetical protein
MGRSYRAEGAIGPRIGKTTPAIRAKPIGKPESEKPRTPNNPAPAYSYSPFFDSDIVRLLYAHLQTSL